MKNKKVLFFGRYKERNSEKLFKILKKKFKYVKVIWSRRHGEKIPKRVLNFKGDYIFCFRSYYILGKNILKNFTSAINFHPGPPSYRGIGCLNFAILKGEKKYGVTAHLINENIDSGKIILTKIFSIKNNDSLSSVLQKTNALNFKLAKEIINIIYDDKYSLNFFIKKNNKRWSRKIYYKKDLERLYEIKFKFNKEKINRIYRATSYKNFKPFILIGNKKLIVDRYL